MEITVCRDTPSAAASSACDISRWVRCSLTRFRMMSRYLYLARDVKHPLQHCAVCVVPAASCQDPSPWGCLDPTSACQGSALSPKTEANSNPGFAYVHCPT